jgi:hypothetical protein
MTNVQGGEAPAKEQKVMKILDNSSTKTTAKQSMSSHTHTVGINYRVCQENLTENLNMCHTAVKFVP